MKYFIVFISLFLLNVISFSEDKHITELQILIKREKKLFEKEKNEYDQKIKKIKTTKEDRIELLEKEKEKLDKVVKSVGEEERKNQYIKSLLNNNKSALKEFNNELIKMIDETINTVNTGIPFQIQRRKDALVSLKKDINENVIYEDEALNRFLIIIESENKLAATSETALSEVIINNTKSSQKEKIKVRIIRLGMVTMAVAEEEGERVFILAKNNTKYSWEKLNKYKDKAAVKNAIKMIEGKKVPELMNFPIYNTIIKKR